MDKNEAYKKMSGGGEAVNMIKDKQFYRNQGKELYGSNKNETLFNPMPPKKKDESKEDYVSRFMSDKEMVKDYPDEKQRAAVAYKTWGEK
jgi:hypothetical protein